MVESKTDLCPCVEVTSVHRCVSACVLCFCFLHAMATNRTVLVTALTTASTLRELEKSRDANSPITVSGIRQHICFLMHLRVCPMLLSLSSWVKCFSVLRKNGLHYPSPLWFLPPPLFLPHFSVRNKTLFLHWYNMCVQHKGLKKV